MHNTDAFAELERGVHAALETYSNVHRGSGHKSMVTTYLFDQARTIVMDYLGLNKSTYVVIFCTQRGAAAFKTKINQGSYKIISSRDIGLSLGVWALAVKKKSLPGGAPFQTGGGTARLVSPGWVIWNNEPDKFEAGTPAIINIIAFARALCLIRQSGNEIFMTPASEDLTADKILYHDELEKYSGKELLDELRQTIIGRNIYVPTVDGLRPFVNLDNGASTPSFAPVWNAVRQSWRQPPQVQQDIIHEVRSICAEMLGASLSNYDLIFTSNTTEAINLAAGSLSLESEEGCEPVILNSLLEHSSNDLPWRLVSNSVIRLSIDNNGFLDMKELDSLLSGYNEKCLYGNKRIRIVAVSGASNVLGVYNDLEEISRIVHRHGARLLVDAAQMAAHRKIMMDQCMIDYLAFSAHKVYAPFGTGVLVVRKGILKFKTEEIEQIRLSGEENAGGIAGLGKALVLLKRAGMDAIREEEQVLTRRALTAMAQITGLQIYGINDPASPWFTKKGGVIVFSLKGMMSNKVAEELAMQGGIGVRYGCHCAHILIKHLVGVGPFLQRIQGIIVTLFPRLRLPGLVRVSLGIGNTPEDIDALIQVLGEISGKNHKISDSSHGSKQKIPPAISRKDLEKQVNNFVRNAASRVYPQVRI